MEYPRPQPAAPCGLDLPAVLSRALVAFIIEFDNEFEHRMPHRTTRHGTTGGLARPPWLVSMAMWAHCMRHVPPDGIPAGELARRSGLSAKSLQTVVKRMSGWWGYLSVTPGPPGAGAKPPRPDWLIRQARETYQRWVGGIEGRWQARFGAQVIGEIGDAARPFRDEALLWQGAAPYPDGWRARAGRPGTLPHYPVLSHRGGFPDGS